MGSSLCYDVMAMKPLWSHGEQLFRTYTRTASLIGACLSAPLKNGVHISLTQYTHTEIEGNAHKRHVTLAGWGKTCYLPPFGLYSVQTGTDANYLLNHVQSSFGDNRSIDSQVKINRRTSGTLSLTWPQKLNRYLAKNTANTGYS